MSISEVIGQDPSRFVAADCGDDGDAGDDALSLCDMPLYGDTADYSFSSDDATSSSSFGDEFFEFSPTYDRDYRDIVFCGKIIPLVEARSAPLPSSPYMKRNKTGITKSVRARARAITYSSARCDKWYMLAFGLARFPSEMALSEIRRRQGKGNQVGANGYQSDSGEIVVSERTRGKKGGRVWGMMKALGCSRRDEGVVACDVVKASFGCFPRM